MQDNLQKNDLLQLQDEGLSLNELYHLVISRWYTILISLGICLGLAGFYILRTPPVYKRTASVLIKDENKGKSFAGDLTSAFSDLGVFQANTNINNELISMKSPMLLKEVIQRLGLRTSYRQIGFFQDHLLYGEELPIKLFFVDVAEESSVSCRLTLDGANVTLYDLKKDDQPLEGGESFKFRADGSLVDSPIGKIKAELKGNASEYREENEFLVTHSPMHQVLSSLGKNLNIIIEDEKSSVLLLSLLDESQERGDEIINTLIAIYNENWLVDRNLSAVNVSSFIDTRLGIIERELGKVDQNITSYKAQHLLPNIETASNLFLNKASEVNSQIIEFSGRVQMAKDIRSLLRSQDKSKLLPVNSFINNPSLEKQIAEYNEILLKRNNLLTNSSENNPLVAEFDHSLEELKRVISVSLDNQLQSLETQLNNLKISERKSVERIAASPEQANFLMTEGRQQKIKEALYLFLLQKKEENELSKAFSTNNTRIISRPHGSPFPEFPNKRNILLAALIVGISLPIAMIYAIILLDDKVRRKDELTNLSLPFLGWIPQLNKSLPVIGRFIKDDIPNKLVVEANANNAINEAFRLLRTNFEFIANQGDKKVVMTTSMVAASGKSFTVINMAKALALKGKKVLVVDLDIRKASLSKSVLKSSQGLTDFLGGMLQDYNSIILHNQFNDGLDFIPVGSIPPNPTELLGTDRLSFLIQELRSKYDYIFLDCPPLGVVADVDIIAPMVDLTLFVVRSGTILKRNLPEIENYYNSKRYPNMVMLMNGVDSSFRSYGYAYGYYGYGN